MARVQLVVVRHGQTEWSRTGRHTGTTDLELEPPGAAQAVAVGAFLARREFSLVLTSPLLRAAETCRLAGYGAQAVDTDDLREWEYGELEGRTTAEIRAERPGWSIWTSGVPRGETGADVGRRADRIVERSRSADGDVLCFSHGHLLRVLAARWVGLPPAAGRLLALDPGSVSVLGWEREVPVVSSWNLRPPGGAG